MDVLLWIFLILGIICFAVHTLREAIALLNELPKWCKIKRGHIYNKYMALRKIKGGGENE